MMSGIKRIMSLLNASGIPFAYDHFAEGESPKPPFICYLCPQSDNFAADGKTYYKISVFHIELYTDHKDVETESSLEDLLDAEGLFYNKTETWIDSEQLYEVLYSLESED